MRGPLLVAAVVLCAGSSGVLHAQRADGLTAGVSVARSSGDLREVDSSGTFAFPAPRLPHVPLAASPAASLVVPGAGQAMLKQQRWVGYVALEGILWWTYSKDLRERREQESAFRDIARRVARAHLSPNGPDGDWTYYETMRDWKESGLFSQSATELDPETDPNTWNGHTWILAQALSPDRPSALAYYSAHAIHPDMAWTWRNADFQLDQFTLATIKRNHANNAANTQLALIAVNHLLSMVDALATFRLQVRPVDNGRTALGATVRW